VVLADIPYRYGAAHPRRYGQPRPVLRIFPGGWWDSEVRWRDHEGERGAR